MIIIQTSKNLAYLKESQMICFIYYSGTFYFGKDQGIIQIKNIFVRNVLKNCVLILYFVIKFTIFSFSSFIFKNLIWPMCPSFWILKIRNFYGLLIRFTGFYVKIITNLVMHISFYQIIIFLTGLNLLRLEIIIIPSSNLWALN